MTEEEEILIARRAFPDSQRLLDGAILREAFTRLGVGWHATAVHPERGAFAVVQRGAGLEDLIGEVLRVSLPGSPSAAQRSVVVYCVGSALVSSPLSLYRRAFLGLAVLSAEELTCRVDVVA